MSKAIKMRWDLRGGRLTGRGQHKLVLEDEQFPGGRTASKDGAHTARMSQQPEKPGGTEAGRGGVAQGSWRACGTGPAAGPTGRRGRDPEYAKNVLPSDPASHSPPQAQDTLGLE